MPWRDEWPSTCSGEPYDGKHLLDLIRSGKSPFDGVWDVGLLVREIEEKLDTKVTDIPMITKGSNNYGFYIKTSNKPDMVARLARGDVNMPGFDGFPIDLQASEARFEVAVYNLLKQEPGVRISRLLYSRIPIQHPGSMFAIPQDLAGRRLFVFESSAGSNNVWADLSPTERVWPSPFYLYHTRAKRLEQLLLLDQLARIRAALFSYNPPREFAAEYFLDRLFKFKPDSLSIPVAPTREFWVHVLEAKIRATIRNEGDMIGWEDDEETVGPIALAAKHSLLHAVQLILPADTPDGSLYRFVLEHGDFGIHNMTITRLESGQPLVTSVFDWETACIWPAILSDPLVAAGPVDLIAGEDGSSAVTRLPENATQADVEDYTSWASHYIKKLYHEAPGYETAIQAGKDFRYLWYALRDWRGGNSEEFFGVLGEWAETRIRKLEAL
ncbi:hypothetical protein H9Q69_008737 [Fusarium xylarioides]|nr:hypothetical protein H9Q70_007828 [Fusarium xylarioides]KAG5784079.1 hypothetical protein H9Q73_002278 [Fusarium xylarioides]KAG5792213.1 hypothetical protein H9Q69_008737 [Fusarium xylarioides]